MFQTGSFEKGIPLWEPQAGQTSQAPRPTGASGAGGEGARGPPTGERPAPRGGELRPPTFRALISKKCKEKLATPRENPKQCKHIHQV